MARFRLTLALALAVSTAAAAQQGLPAISGKVQETLESGGYTYLRLSASKGDVWAAVPKTQVSVGQTIQIQPQTLMQNFTSPTLKRQFPQIYFATLVGQAAQGAPASGSSAPAAAPEKGISGKVLEKVSGGGYSYLLLKTAEGEIWAAVPEAKTAVGATVTVHNASDHDGFESKTLKRRFDRIVFGTLDGQTLPPPAPVKAAAPAAPVGKAEVRTIAQLHKDKAALAGKAVTVTGKVVKFTGGVMGKNWLHLRDGTGSDEKKDNDVAVTTQADAAMGDQVTVTGVLAADKDIGAGYHFDALIEDASLAKAR